MDSKHLILSVIIKHHIPISFVNQSMFYKFAYASEMFGSIKSCVSDLCPNVKLVDMLMHVQLVTHS